MHAPFIWVVDVDKNIEERQTDVDENTDEDTQRNGYARLRETMPTATGSTGTLFILLMFDVFLPYL